MSNAVSMVTYCTYQLNAATFQEGSHLALCLAMSAKCLLLVLICSIWQLSCLTNMAHVYLFYLNIIWWLNHWKEESYNIQNRALHFIFNFMIWLVWYSRLLLYKFHLDRPFYIKKRSIFSMPNLNIYNT